MATFYLDHKKPTVLSESDISTLCSALARLHYAVTRAELIQMAKKKRSVFLRQTGDNKVKGYAELHIKGKVAHIDWIFAPSLGEQMVQLILQHIRTEMPKIRRVNLIVEVDKMETGSEKMTKARFNLYFKCGFTIDAVEFVKNVTIYAMKFLL